MGYSRVLVTGGAGFIGSHVVDDLIKKGFQVKVLDNLEPQVHASKVPDYLNPEADFIKGDIRDPNDLRRALTGVGGVIHEASLVGVNQSQALVERYTSVNDLGTAMLWQVIKDEHLPIKKVVVASSCAVYGEGAYVCDEHGEVYPDERDMSQLLARDWDVKCPLCNRKVQPTKTRESKPSNVSSIYALNKLFQEKASLIMGRSLGISTVALRYFNVFGERQALNNPYSGVFSIFMSRLINRKPPIVFEDGMQTRSFIYVKDAAEATVLALEHGEGYAVYNVGADESVAIGDVAKKLIEIFDPDLEPKFPALFRVGDVRHSIPDVTRIRKDLGFVPKNRLEDVLEDYVKWVLEQPKPKDNFEEMLGDFKSKELIK